MKDIVNTNDKKLDADSLNEIVNNLYLHQVAFKRSFEHSSSANSLIEKTRFIYVIAKPFGTSI